MFHVTGSMMMMMMMMIIIIILLLLLLLSSSSSSSSPPPSARCVHISASEMSATSIFMAVKQACVFYSEDGGSL